MRNTGPTVMDRKDGMKEEEIAPPTHHCLFKPAGPLKAFQVIILLSKSSHLGYFLYILRIFN